MSEPFALETADFLLTTNDNPFSPYNDWDKWIEWDLSHGYDCCGKVARFATHYPSISDRDSDIATTQAILDIIGLFPEGPYCLAFPTE